MARLSNLLGRRSGPIAGLVVLVLLLHTAGGATAAPRGGTTQVLAITQSDHVTDQGTFTVAIHLADASQVSLAYFTFCQITSPVCYSPVLMTAQGSNWLSGTTKPMPSYPGMTQGTTAGYNITLNFADNTNLSEPSLPNTFANLSVAPSVSGFFYFLMAVQDPVYDLTGVVSDSVTGTGIVGATVELGPANNTTLTDASGIYQFAGLLNGTYQLSVTGAGYSAGSATVTVAGQPISRNIVLTNTSAGNGTGGGAGTPSSALGTLSWYELLAVAAVALIVIVILAMTYTRRKGRAPPS